MPELKRGYQGPLYAPWFSWASRKYSRLAGLLGRNDEYFGSDEEAWTRALQHNLGIVQDGVFGDRTAAAAGYTWPGAAAPPLVLQRRPIWQYSAPGSGAPGHVGPAFQLAERVKREMNINHQIVDYPIGGYLGLMGGPPDLSYNDVVELYYQSLRRLLGANPDVHAAMAARRADRNARVAVELWIEAYSQSADAARRAVLRLFGDGGEYELIRDRINGLILFGDPGARGTGISGILYPDWLERLVVPVNYPNDFYAYAPDRIRRAMFPIVTAAEVSLPFFVQVLRLGARVIPDWLTFLPVGGLLGQLGGGMFGPLAQLSVSAMTGLSGNPLLSQMMGMAGSAVDAKLTEDLYQILRPTGMLSSIPDMVQLVGALPGLQAHGTYEFDPHMMNLAWSAIARPQRDQQGNRLLR